MTDYDPGLWKNSPFPPREWQADALPACIDAAESGTNGVVSAIMGAGKSLVIGALVDWYSDAGGQGQSNAPPCIISTPTIDLVDQLYDTVTDFLHPMNVGKYYTHSKDTHHPIIVTCLPSVGGLFEEMRESGQSEIGLWIADECHRTECDSIKDPYMEMEVGSLIGFSATPFRNLESETLSLFQEELYDYGPYQAMKDGVIVEPRPVHFEKGAKVTPDDFDKSCIHLIDHLVDDKGIDEPIRGICNAKTIDGAESFAGQLTDYGYRAKPVHSQHDEEWNDRAMSELKVGEIDVVVHVNKLSEGVDFPWLKWLCLRRPTSSKVRFCQEVGRALRAYEGKEYAWILDPHYLFNSFGFKYEAAIGGLYDMDGLDDQEEAEYSIGDALDEMRDMMEAGTDSMFDLMDTDDQGTPVKVLEPVQSWICNTKIKLKAEGIVEPEVTSRGWRDDPVTSGQKQYISILKEDFMRGPQHSLSERRRDTLRSAFRCLDRGSLTKGDASDLIDILKVLNSRGQWPQELQ